MDVCPHCRYEHPSRVTGDVWWCAECGSLIREGKPITPTVNDRLKCAKGVIASLTGQDKAEVVV